MAHVTPASDATSTMKGGKKKGRISLHINEADNGYIVRLNRYNSFDSDDTEKVFASANQVVAFVREKLGRK